MTGNTALNIGALFTELRDFISDLSSVGTNPAGLRSGEIHRMTTIPDAEAEAYSWMGTPVIGRLPLTVASNTAPIIRTGHAAR